MSYSYSEADMIECMYEMACDDDETICQGAIDACIDILSDKAFGWENLSFLKFKKIKGTMLYQLWNDCCSRDISIFHITIQILRNKYFTDEEIIKNLTNVRSIPFLDRSVEFTPNDISSYLQKATSKQKELISQMTINR